MEAATGESPEREKGETDPKLAEEQLRQEGWPIVECCPKAAEDGADRGPVNVGFESRHTLLCKPHSFLL